MSLGLQPSSSFRGLLSPVVVVAWLWAGLLILLLFYLATVLLQPPSDAASRFADFREFWLGPSALGMPLRWVVKVVNVLLVVLLYLRWRSLRRRPEGKSVAGRLLYFGTALLILALEWACHVLSRSLPPA